MARLGTIFLKNFNFLTNGNLYINRVQCEFSPFISTIKTDYVQKLKDLGVPEKPKKPANPYLIFAKDAGEKLKKEEPLMSKVQQFKKCGEMWKALNSDQRAKYHQIFKDLQEKYESEILHFKANLTKEQKFALESLSEAKKKARQGRRKRKELAELGKPKHPQNAYALYVSETSKMRNLPMAILLKDVAEEWKSMTDTEKNVYREKAKKLREDYEKKLKLWEDKMKIEGREDLIRKTPHDSKMRKKSRILKYGLPEDQNH